MKLFFRIACLALLLSATLADDFGFDLSAALDDDGKKPTDKPQPKKDGDIGFDLSDAFGGDEEPFPAKPPVINPNPSGGGGGGTIRDSDLTDIGGGGNYEPDGGKYQPDGGRYQPDGGRYGGGGGDPGYNSGDDQPQEAGSGQIAGIVSAIGVALVGAASSYFAYQKKKLCFKLRGGQDPESGNRHMTQSEPQVMSNLMEKS